MRGPNLASMRRFNHLHAKMRVVVENAFGRLKGRWHVLRMINAHPELAASVQHACILLHNFLEDRNGAYEADPSALEEDSSNSVVAAESDETPSSAGARRRIELVKALGLPWVDAPQ